MKLRANNSSLVHYEFNMDVLLKLKKCIFKGKNKQMNKRYGVMINWRNLKWIHLHCPEIIRVMINYHQWVQLAALIHEYILIKSDELAWIHNWHMKSTWIDALFYIKTYQIQDIFVAHFLKKQTKNIVLHKAQEALKTKKKRLEPSTKGSGFNLLCEPCLKNAGSQVPNLFRLANPLNSDMDYATAHSLLF